MFKFRFPHKPNAKTKLARRVFFVRKRTLAIPAGLAAVFVPVAVALGFRNEELIALLIMLGSPTTPSSYVMAKNMGHEGVLTSSCIATTTLLSALTLTGWIFLLRSRGYL